MTIPTGWYEHTDWLVCSYRLVGMVSCLRDLFEELEICGPERRRGQRPSPRQRGARQLRELRAIPRETLQRGGERAGDAGVVEQPVHAVLDDLAVAAAARGHDRHARRLPLEQHAGQG